MVMTIQLLRRDKKLYHSIDSYPSKAKANRTAEHLKEFSKPPSQQIHSTYKIQYRFIHCIRSKKRWSQVGLYLSRFSLSSHNPILSSFLELIFINSLGADDIERIGNSRRPPTILSCYSLTIFETMARKGDDMWSKASIIPVDCLQWCVSASPCVLRVK